MTYPNVLVMGYLKEAGQLTPEWRAKLEAAINAGWQRLLTFEAKGGGFDWYPGGQARTILTAYGVLELSDMDKVYPIDRRVIERAVDVLWSRQDRDGAWNLDVPMHTWHQMGDGRLPITAYVSWALSEAGVQDERLLRAKNWLRTKKADDPYVQALVALALGGESARELERSARVEGPTAAWETKGEGLVHARGQGASIEATSMAALALLKEGKSPLIDKALTLIARSKDAAGSWGSTQATILAIKALLEASKTPLKPAGDVDVRLFVNGKEILQAFRPIGKATYDLVQQIEIPAAERETVVEVEADLRAGVQVSGRYYLPWALAPEPAEPPLAIKVAYDRDQLKLGEKVKATATLSYGGPGTFMVIADLGVPPGFTPDASAFEALVKKGTIDKYSITGRQITLYFGRMEKGRRHEIEYTLTPRFPIRAQTPGSGAYEYYTPENRGSGRPSTLRVLEEF